MIHLTVQTVLTIDLCTLLVCGLIALRCASSVIHPALMMLGCHAYIVTLRLVQILQGARPMSYTFVWPVATEELTRAAVASDVALLAMSFAWILVRFWGNPRVVQPREPRIMLSFPRVRACALLVMLIAVGGIAVIGPHNLVALPESQDVAGPLVNAASWGPWACVLLHYLYGFPIPLLGLTAITLVVTMLLSHFRGVVIIPLIFLLFTWLSRRKSGRLPLALAPAAVVLWLLWLPMKPIIHSLQTGKSLTESLSYGIDIAFNNFGKESGSGIDFQFLDMIGSTMTLVDIHGTHFWGSSIAPLIVSPVPRSVWPAKPRLNQYQKDLDIPSRNMAALNMTAGLVGESYANFGYLGVIVVPFLISLCFTLAYRRLSGTSLLTPGALLYLIYLSTFMQLYRDGLVSAIWFPFVYCAPIGWTAVSHWIWPPGKGRSRVPQTIPPANRFEYLPS
jgi:hypothetical protein